MSPTIPPSPKLTRLVTAHSTIQQAADAAATAIAVERAKERDKARLAVADAIVLRREQFSLTEINRRYGARNFPLATMCDVEDGVNVEPGVMLRYAFFVLEFAKWKGLQDTGTPLPPPRPGLDPDEIMPMPPEVPPPPITPGDIIADPAPTQPPPPAPAPAPTPPPPPRPVDPGSLPVLNDPPPPPRGGIVG